MRLDASLAAARVSSSSSSLTASSTASSMSASMNPKPSSAGDRTTSGGERFAASRANRLLAADALGGRGDVDGGERRVSETAR